MVGQPERAGELESMKARMLRGEEYIADDPQLNAERLRCRGLVERYNASSPGDGAARAVLLAELLSAVGERTLIEPPFRCDYGYNIRIGSGSFINYGAVFLDVNPIEIGDDVQIAPNVQLLTATHPLEAARRRAQWESGGPISIGDGAWLGGGVIVLPGVSIGVEAIVGAGAVVTRHVEPRTVVAGNPARILRRLE